MNETVTLKDNREVSIRPLQRGDLEGLLAFFKALPEEDRVFLRMDVTNRALVERRYRDTIEGDVHRIVAEADGRIVASGVLDCGGRDWEEHVGELRLIVARDYQRAGLGMYMARELYLIAVREKVEEIVVKMMGPQKSARTIFHRLGFQEEFVLPHYVKDRKGRLQDLVMMRCELRKLLDEMKHHFSKYDLQPER